VVDEPAAAIDDEIADAAFGGLDDYAVESANSSVFPRANVDSIDQRLLQSGRIEETQAPAC